MIRFLKKLRYYIRPEWRTLKCPECGELTTARSGPHMTDQIHGHNLKHHPYRVKRRMEGETHEQFLFRLLDIAAQEARLTNERFFAHYLHHGKGLDR
jgi:hypothetical protein